MGFFDNILDETHLTLRDMAKRFALKEIRPYSEAWEEAGQFPRELYGTIDGKRTPDGVQQCEVV